MGMVGVKGSRDNTSQRHGVDIENVIKTAWMFQNATNVQRSGVAVFDIEGTCDPLLGLNTSVKSTGNGVIGLADGPRFCGIALPWRMIAVEWRQHGDVKSFHRVHRMIIPRRVMKRIIGDLTEDEMLGYHNEIASFAPGKEAAAQARRRYAQIKASVKGRQGILRLDFKVDDGSQRRLQVSICLPDLIAILRSEEPYLAKGVSHPLHEVYEDRFEQFVLPIQMVSTKRRIDREERVAEPATGLGTLLADPAPPSPTKDPESTPIFRPTPVRHDARPRRDAKQPELSQISMF